MSTSKIGLLALCVVSLAACGGSSGRDELGNVTRRANAADDMPFPPTPDPDPFYAEPDPLPDVPPGTVLASRAVKFAPVGLSLPNPAWQLQYMSTDMHGNPQTAIATIVQPLLPALGGVRPLLSYQFAVNSPGLKCAPSHQVTGSTANLNSQLEALEYVPMVLALGWTVVFPDHLGPTSSVGVGRIAAPIVLDGMRAALAFEPLGLADDTPIGMLGYSGGALATTWSAALQPTYAPELNLVGVAAGGLPADLEVTARAFDGGPFFAIAFGAVLSINRVFPELVPPEIWNEKGLRAAEAVKDGCLGQPTDGSPAPSGRFTDYTTVEDVYETPGARAVLPELTLPQPGEVPTADVFFYHQALDQLAPLAPLERVVDAWCAEGAHLHTFVDLTGEHFAGAVTSAPTEIAYLVGRFAGLDVLPPTTRSCN